MSSIIIDVSRYGIFGLSKDRNVVDFWLQWAAVSASGRGLIVTNVGRPPPTSFSQAQTTLTGSQLKGQSFIWVTINSLIMMIYVSKPDFCFAF